MASWSFQGTYTALVTPFVAGAQSIDFDALDRLVEDQIAGGIAGLVPCGTTGETPTLSEAEQLAVIERVAKVAAGRVPVVAGTGSNSTDKSVKASQAALEAGADGVMIVMPYYNKPAQQGMREHVVTIAKAVDCPVIVYNIPGRSVVDLSAETTEAICAAADNVVAIKDATGNVLRCQELKRRLGDRLAVMCGDDGLTLPMMAVGAAGVISVSANVLPDKVSAVTALMAQGKLDEARAKHFELLNFHGLMFAEPNPGPCKATAALLGRMQPDVRLPLLPAADATRARIEAALFELGIKR
jgi:4-hydroxy-tetrahydrodipicolinate synthase